MRHLPDHTTATHCRQRNGLPGVLVAAMLLAVPGAATAADVERGAALAEQWCNACHSVGREPPRQFDAGPMFADLAKKDEAYLVAAIRRPHDFMPEFPRLDETDLADLVAYIMTVE